MDKVRVRRLTLHEQRSVRSMKPARRNAVKSKIPGGAFQLVCPLYQWVARCVCRRDGDGDAPTSVERFGDFGG